MQLQTHIWERHYGNEPKGRHSFSITVNERVGLPDYKTYLESPHWLATRAAYVALYGDRCRWLRRWDRQRCGAEPVEIHHLTYERLGAEQMDDLIGLCGKHHEDAHAIADAKRQAAMIDRVIDEDGKRFER